MSADDTPVAGVPVAAADGGSDGSADGRPDDPTDDGTDDLPADGTDDGIDEESPPSGRRRRPIVLAAIALVLLAGVGAGLVVTRHDDPPPPRPDIPLDAWAPYWALDASLPELEQRLPALRDVSPFWFNAIGETEIVVDENTPIESAGEFVDLVRRSEARLVPSIVDATPSGEMAAILADPDRRGRHVDALLTFAADGDYDGLDLDYEQFAFADGRSTWATTRPNWVTFIEELADGLHADGRTLTVSIPYVYDDERTPDSGFWVYDHGAIAPLVDRIRIMAYDYSVGEPGPIAPLSFVEAAIEGAIAVTGAPEKLVLGMPAYGRNWVEFVSGDCPESAEGTTSVTARTVDDLIARRDAVPVFVETTGESTFEYDLEVTEGDVSCVQTRRVHYVDAEGVRRRMDLAREYHLDGVSLWALGFEDDAVWDAILPTVADPRAATVPADR